MKVILKYLAVVFTAVLAVSCSSSPWVGKWVPDNDQSGESILQFNEDGTAEFIGNADDGSYYISGNYTVEEGENVVLTIKYDASTKQSNNDNPLAEMMILRMLDEMAQHELKLTLSDDEEMLIGDTPGKGGFVRYE